APRGPAKVKWNAAIKEPFHSEDLTAIQGPLCPRVGQGEYRDRHTGNQKHPCNKWLQKN
ncbi:unnamed protein product, partial [Gulo gulo]